MSEEEPVFTSLKDRIAALNLQNGGGAPPSRPVAPKPKVAPKVAPKAPVRPAPSPVSGVSSAASSWATPSPAPVPKRAPPIPAKRSPSVGTSPSTKPSLAKPTPAPSLPVKPPPSPPIPARVSISSRSPSAETSAPEPAHSPAALPGRARPPLPTRRPSADPVKGSGRVAEAIAASSARRLPPTAPAKPLALPKLPVEEEKEEHTLPLPAERTRPPLPGGRPGLPPRLPTRQEEEHEEDAHRPPVPQNKPTPAASRRTLPPAVPLAMSPPPPPTASRPGAHSNGGPPPIPLNSRPPPVPLGSRRTSKPAPVAEPVQVADGFIGMPPVTCLVCRDYSAPDDVAAQYPREYLPSDPVGYLAHCLCSPFEYYTDKARAIFTWCHHNIQYDVKNFLAGTIQGGHTAEDTIRLGTGVCDGYSKVFRAIAERAGMECIAVTGHGKGYGYKAPAPGVVPRYESNHAWNAVRLDDGGWKTVDACWGAGSLTNGVWETTFKPMEFTMSNDAFGERHFPTNPDEQFRNDGRELSWDEYILGGGGGETPTFCTDGYKEGLDPTGLEPVVKYLDPYAHAQGGMVRFQIPWVCDHWAENVVAKRGGPLLLMVCTGDDTFPMDYTGEWWYVDVPADQIRKSLMIAGLDTLGGQGARGTTKEQFLKKKGRVGYSFTGIAVYEIV